MEGRLAALVAASGAGRAAGRLILIDNAISHPAELDELLHLLDGQARLDRQLLDIGKASS